MKIINATSWSTDALQATVERACQEIKDQEQTRSAYEEVCFKPTSSYREPVHTGESKTSRRRLDVFLWQPVKLKNKLDELTLIAAVTGDDGFVMPSSAAAKLLVHLKNSLGGRFGYGVELNEVAKKIKNPPVIPERAAEEGRIDDATMQLGLANTDIENLRSVFAIKERSILNKIEKLQKIVDFNKKKLDKVKKEQLANR